MIVCYAPIEDAKEADKDTFYDQLQAVTEQVPTHDHTDHILINGKWRSSLQDVRAYRGADVASDRNLLVTVVSLKLRRARKGQRSGHQFDSIKLRDDWIRQVFRRELKNRFQILGEEQEMNIDSFNQTFKAAGEKVLGFKKRKKRE